MTALVRDIWPKHEAPKSWRPRSTSSSVRSVPPSSAGCSLPRAERGRGAGPRPPTWAPGSATRFPSAPSPSGTTPARGFSKSTSWLTAAAAPRTFISARSARSTSPLHGSSSRPSGASATSGWAAACIAYGNVCPCRSSAPDQLHHGLVPTHHVRRVPARHDHRIEFHGGYHVGLDINRDGMAALGSSRRPAASEPLLDPAVAGGARSS